MEVLKSSKSIGQIARAYGVHPITIHKWKRDFMEKGPEIFGQETTIHDYEKNVRELEQLIGHKEVEIARQHPEYGYRRTTSELVDRGFAVNHKVVQRLHRYWYLSVIKKVRAPKPNPIGQLLKEAGSKINLVAHLKEINDFEVLYQ